MVKCEMSYACGKIACREWLLGVFVCIVVFYLPQYSDNCLGIFLLYLMIYKHAQSLFHVIASHLDVSIAFH